ncbi:MAG: hypothetical protein KatS3mg107_0754 [Gemmataceae bacterium]|nr:MAG: hypothetical protein KatS3mg107_0754 [Gemmataceae bacterium]
MQVHPSGSHPYVNRHQPELTPPPRVGGTDPVGDPAAPLASNHFSPTEQFSQLLLALQQLPDVRTDVIEAVAARLANGELESPQAAAETARALLQHPVNEPRS